jgi:hypothetical protein
MKEAENNNELLVNIHLKDYEIIREEIILRLKEKNLLIRYLILLIGAVIAGLWSDMPGVSNNIILMIILLIIIPIISLILIFLYNWHDECIVKLAFYLHNEVRPKLCSLLETDDIFTWENLQHDFRRKSSFFNYANLGRLIFVVPILISVTGYILIENLQTLGYVKWFFISMDIIIMVFILFSFIKINAKYRNLTKLKSENKSIGRT